MTLTSSSPQEGPAHETVPVLTLVKQIKDGKLDPLVLTVEDRRRCVDVFLSEGYSAAESAQILKVGERTIYRDRADLRAAHALHVHPQFPLQMAGELMRQAEGSMGRLRRIAREPQASAMERAMAEQFAFKVYLDSLTKLQSMGYLPRVPTGIVAQVVGGSPSDAIATSDQLNERLKELEIVDRELGFGDPQEEEHRRKLANLVERARLAAEVDCTLQRSQNRN